MTIDNRMRRRRYDAARRALYALVELLRADGREAQSLERWADNLGEFVPDDYAGRTE